MNTWLEATKFLLVLGAVTVIFYVGTIAGELQAAVEFEASDERKAELLKKLRENQGKCRSIIIMNNNGEMYSDWLEYHREKKMLKAKSAVQDALVNVRRLLKHKTLDSDQREEARNIEKFLIVTELKLIAYNNKYSPLCKMERELYTKNIMKDFDGGESDG